jgi:transketolase
MKNYDLAVKAIKILCADMVQKANSGHPGAPLGMAEMAVKLWCDHLHHNPFHPEWFNRDRFILSNGHASALQYALLHLSGYQVSLEDLKNFRQLHSNTPGHPEYGITTGVETSTGPLGQGLANAVGMALIEKLLAKEFNKPGYKVVDHYTYAFVGDGCLMEGISHEVCSLAGTLELGRLIVLYDSNQISIDGRINSWFNEDVAARYRAYNWHVISVNGHDLDEIDDAIREAKLEKKRPSLIICSTIIGNGAVNKQDSASCHGSPLGASEIAILRQNLGWNHDPFVIPEQVYEQFAASVEFESKWDTLLLEYEREYPDLYKEFQRRIDGKFSNQFLSVQDKQWLDFIDVFASGDISKYQNFSTRKASQDAISYYFRMVPELFGGSADLTESNCTNWKGYIPISLESGITGNYISGGVREFGLAAMANGMVLHKGYKVFTATFLTFSDYARNAIRMACLMKIPTIFVYTHDSIGLGEDGPTHQPIEHLSSLRMIPNLHVWRPADIQETVIAWGQALSSEKSPSALVFARQNTSFIKKDSNYEKDIIKGGYIVSFGGNNPDIIIIATGTELEIAVKVAEQINRKTQKIVRVVSMPSTNVFDEQSLDYKQMVLPKAAKLRVAIEAGRTDLWYKYVGLDGVIFGIDTFGESAPAIDLYEYFGLTAEKISEEIIQKL